MKKKIKKCLYVVGGTLGTGLVITGAFVLFNKPSKVRTPCWRSFNRADGTPKIAFDSPQRANLQSVKQLFLHGEVCNPYQAGDKYYTGHSKNAFIKNINPFKC